MHMTTGSVVVLLIGTTLAVAGCSSPPPPVGRTSGRIAPTTITAAEERSRAVTNDSLVRFAQESAEKLVRDLADRRIFGITDQDVLVTIIIGDIRNQTQGRVQTQDFEMVVTRMRSTLLGSDIARDNIRFQRTRARVDRVRRRERPGAAADPLQRDRRTGSGVRESDPEYTFFLDGNMFARASQTPVRYYLNFELVREIDGEIVWAADYEENRR